MFRVLSALIATLALVVGAASAVGGSASAAIGDCASLNGTAIPAASIGLPTGGALVTSTTLAATPVANCQVNGRIDPCFVPWRPALPRGRSKALTVALGALAAALSVDASAQTYA